MLLSQAQDPQDAMPKKRDAKKSSQCPPPIRPLSGASWRPPKPQPIQLPTDWPPMFPTNLRDETTLIMLDCAKQCTGLVGFCRCVVAQLTPLFTRDTNAPRPDLISLALNELLRYILITNEGNADERYRLHQEVWQSNEWATLVKAASKKKATSAVMAAVAQEEARSALTPAAPSTQGPALEEAEPLPSVRVSAPAEEPASTLVAVQPEMAGPQPAQPADSSVIEARTNRRKRDKRRLQPMPKYRGRLKPAIKDAWSKHGRKADYRTICRDVDEQPVAIDESEYPWRAPGGQRGLEARYDGPHERNIKTYLSKIKRQMINAKQL